MKIINLSLIFALLFNNGSALALDSVEKSIAAQVKSNSERALETLERAVNINSGTMNFAGVEEVGNLFKAQFNQLNFETQWIEGAHFNRAGHLLASHTASIANSPKVLLIGHLDTVFGKNDSFQKFMRIDQSYVAGPGITDMKGGDVIIIESLSALHELGLLEGINIRVVLSGDEEYSGRPLSDSKKILIEAAQWADIALGFEDGDSNINTAVIARRGAVQWQLDVSGKPAHSSQIFQDEVGYGAIFETARIIDQFRLQLAGTGDLTFNPGVMVAGTSIEYDQTSSNGSAFGKSNVIAKTAKVTGGIRALSMQELDNAKTVMQKIIADNLAHTSATLTFEPGYPPMAPTAENRALLALYSNISESLGYNVVTPVNPRNAGAADISFTAGLVDMALDGLGLMGRGGHTKDEVADMTSLLKNTQKAAILIYRLSEQGSDKP
jgi:glutamate carboxypeptidase